MYTETDHNLITRADWVNPEDIEAVIREIWQGRDYKEPHEKAAYRNREFLKGNQWYVWSDRKKEMVPSRKRPGWQTKHVYNDTIQAVENRKYKLVRHEPGWNTISPTEDPGDKVVQKTTDQVMSWEWTDGVRMPEKTEMALTCAMTDRIVFGHPFWNKDKGPKLRITLDEYRAGAAIIEDPALQEDFIRQQDSQFIQAFGQDAYQRGYYEEPTGDFDVEVVPLFEVCWWPFNAKSDDDVRIYLRTVKKTPEEIADWFGLTIDEVLELSQPRPTLGSARMNEWADLYFSGENAQQNDCSIYVHYIYKKPSKKYPRGRMAVMLGENGRLIYGPDDINNVAGVMPLKPFREFEIPGEFVGRGIVDFLISPQTEINLTLSQIADYRNRRLMPTLVEFAGNPKQDEALSNAPGKKYKALSPELIPQVIQMPDIGSDYFNTHTLNRMWMQDLSGNADITKGRTDDADVTSGRAIHALREMSDSKLVPTGKRLDRWCEWLGEFGLLELQEKVIVERLVHIIGDKNVAEVVSFKGTDLQPSTYTKGQTDKALIKVTSHSIIPKTFTELMNFVSMALSTAGPDGRTLLDPEMDRNEIMDMLSMGQFRKAFDKQRPDTLRQHTEIEAWKRGELVGMPHESDEDTTHRKMLDSWMKTDEYRQIIENPQMLLVALDIRNHYEAHKKGEARKLVEPEYLIRRADVSEWMQNREQMMSELSSAGDPAFAKMVTDSMFPAPLTLMAAAAAAPQPEQSGGGGEKKKKTRLPNGQSDKQGVSKEEQKNG